MTGDAREALESLVQEAFIDVYGEYHLAIPSDELRGRLMSLAAGFTLPRTVSTVEELHGLAVGSAVLVKDGGVAQRVDHDSEGLDWMFVGSDEYREPAEFDGMLPATVLYEPEAK